MNPIENVALPPKLRGESALAAIAFSDRYRTQSFAQICRDSAPVPIAPISARSH